MLTLLRLLLFLGATVPSWVSAPFATRFSLFGLFFVLLLISGVVGAVSLILDRGQGFFGFYSYCFVATFGMAIFVFPFPVALFPFDVTRVTLLLIAFNLAVCLLVVALHLWGSRAQRRSVKV